MTVYSLGATHLESVMLTVQTLNDLEKSLDAIVENDDTRKVGEGHLALPESPIRIVSDAYDFAMAEPEVLGWVVRGDVGWDFTQTDPNTTK